jgi:DNA-binding transcriptional LysR family regulator
LKAPLDSRQLRAFCSLARTGNFTRTARELHLTQSGISHSMRALERDVGCRLLDRLGKKVMLTQAGEQLFRHAKRIISEMETARGSLLELGKSGHGRLRLGASSTACQHLIPPVLRQFRESFPEHVISLEADDVPALADALLQYRIDLAVTLEIEKEPQLAFYPLFDDELCFVVSPQHPWARAGKAERSEISQQSLFLCRWQSVTFRIIENYFLREELVLNNVVHVGSTEAAKELVKLGLGASILASWTARKELDEGSLVALPLGRKKLARRWGVTHWRGKQLNPAEKTFIAICDAACAPLRPHTNGEAPVMTNESATGVMT